MGENADLKSPIGMHNTYLAYRRRQDQQYEQRQFWFRKTSSDPTRYVMRRALVSSLNFQGMRKQSLFIEDPKNIN